MDKEKMQKTNALEVEPNELQTVETLLAYQQNYDTGFQFTEKEAEVLLGYLEGHGYLLGEKDGTLYRGDMCEEQNKVHWEEYLMDDVIDLACEWNYELILEAEAGRNQSENFTEDQNRYDSLKVDETVLDALFDRTRYGKEMDELARKLADDIIKKYKQGEDVTKTVTAIMDGAKAYSIDGRGR